MEQYILTLIAAGSAFLPSSNQIIAFFGLLTTAFGFRIISDRPFQPGLRVMKPSGAFRHLRDSFTGEVLLSIPAFDHIEVERIIDFPSKLEGLDRYSALASGEWTPETRPVTLLTAEKVPLEGSYNCEVSCHIEPELVSTSCWNAFAAPNRRNVPEFGTAAEVESKIGLFSHPWTNVAMEVPDAGCARFWIELEFGKFLLPKMSDTLNVLDPAMVLAIEECFGTSFVQGYRFH